MIRRGDSAALAPARPQVGELQRARLRLGRAGRAREGRVEARRAGGRGVLHLGGRGRGHGWVYDVRHSFMAAIEVTYER